jgi:hypothetical protein
MTRLITAMLLLLLTACSTVEKTETVVLKSTWVWCWNKCGRKDNLASVSNSACVCSNGAVVPLQPMVPEATGPGLMDRFTVFLESIGK